MPQKPLFPPPPPIAPARVPAAHVRSAIVKAAQAKLPEPSAPRSAPVAPHVRNAIAKSVQAKIPAPVLGRPAACIQAAAAADDFNLVAEEVTDARFATAVERGLNISQTMLAVGDHLGVPRPRVSPHGTGGTGNSREARHFRRNGQVAILYNGNVNAAFRKRYGRGSTWSAQQMHDFIFPREEKKDEEPTPSVDASTAARRAVNTSRTKKAKARAEKLQEDVTLAAFMVAARVQGNAARRDALVDELVRLGVSGPDAKLTAEREFHD